MLWIVICPPSCDVRTNVRMTQHYDEGPTLGDRHDASVDADTATPGSVRSQGGQENSWGAGTADARVDDCRGAAATGPVSVMIGAPHTSNWDLFLMLWLCWASDVEPRFLMKKEAFRGPGATAFRRLGGIAVDRSNPGTLLEDLSARAGSALATGDRLQIVIAPEGTRKAGTYWKSGFYRLAHQSSIPICLGWCDGPTRTVGYGPTIRTTGDVSADMDRSGSSTPPSAG